MNDLASKLKFNQSFRIELDMFKSEFVHHLNSIVDEGSISVFFRGFEAFSRSKNDFIGKVDTKGFEFRRRSRFFTPKGVFAVAKGSYTEEDGRLVIKGDINGLNNSMKFFALMMTLVYSFALFSFFFAPGELKVFAIFVLMHGVMMFAIFYFLVKKSTQDLKHMIEREFYYLTKKT